MSETMTGPLRVAREQDVWTLTLARPEKRNALSAGLVDAMLETVEQAPGAGARVLVFRGEGRSFSAGFDFTDVEAQSEGELVLRFIRIEMLFQAVLRSPCLTLAFAHGRNFGAGVDLFAACRRRVAAPDATFRMPGLKFGLVLGTRRFGQIVGPDHAARILGESATFGAARAMEIGFAHSLSGPDAWDEAIAEARRGAASLDDAGRAALYAALAPDRSDEDLATLVRSAARPGLKDRIARYLDAG